MSCPARLSKLVASNPPRGCFCFTRGSAENPTVDLRRLSGIPLAGIDFTGTTLRWTTVPPTQLSFDGAILKGLNQKFNPTFGQSVRRSLLTLYYRHDDPAVYRRVNLADYVRTRTDFTGVTFSGSQLDGQSLAVFFEITPDRGAGLNLRGAIFAGSDFQGFDFSRKKLDGVIWNLPGSGATTQLKGARFMDTDFGTPSDPPQDFTGVSFEGCRFNRSALESLLRIAKPGTVNVSKMDASILSEIDASSVLDRSLKIQLFTQFIAKSPTFSDDRQVDLLYGYCDDPGINTFVTTQWLPYKIKMAETQMLPISEAETTVVLNNLDVLAHDLFARYSGGYVNQVLVQSSLGAELETRWHDTEPLKSAIKASTQASIIMEPRDYVFFVKAGRFLGIEKSRFVQFMSPDNFRGMDTHFLCSYGDPVLLQTGKRPLSEFLVPFRLLHNKYTDISSLRTENARYLRVLVGDTLLFNHFLAAQRVDLYRFKLIDDVGENTLKVALYKHLHRPPDEVNLQKNMGLKITSKHEAMLLDAFGNPAAQGELFLTLAAMMTKYSSRAIFGSMETSPQPLRFYAVAMVNRALDLGTLDFYRALEYKSVLLGINRECTDTLFEQMQDEHASQFLPSIFPPSWV